MPSEQLTVYYGAVLDESVAIRRWLTEGWDQRRLFEFKVMDNEWARFSRVAEKYFNPIDVR